jgi:hypothetical protein
MAMVMKRASKCLVLVGFPYSILLISSCLSHVTSLSFNYNFSDPNVLAGANLKYFNDSVPAIDRIDLTNSSRSWSTGRVAHGQPVNLWDDSTGRVASFTTNFTFLVKPVNSSSPASRNFMMHGQRFSTSPFCISNFAAEMLFFLSRSSCALLRIRWSIDAQKKSKYLFG